MLDEFFDANVRPAPVDDLKAFARWLVSKGLLASDPESVVADFLHDGMSPQDFEDEKEGHLPE